MGVAPSFSPSSSSSLTITSKGAKATAAHIPYEVMDLIFSNMIDNERLISIERVCRSWYVSSIKGAGWRRIGPSITNNTIWLTALGSSKRLRRTTHITMSPHHIEYDERNNEVRYQYANCLHDHDIKGLIHQRCLPFSSLSHLLHLHIMAQTSLSGGLTIHITSLPTVETITIDNSPTVELRSMLVLDGSFPCLHTFQIRYVRMLYKYVCDAPLLSTLITDQWYNAEYWSRCAPHVRYYAFCCWEARRSPLSQSDSSLQWFNRLESLTLVPSMSPSWSELIPSSLWQEDAFGMVNLRCLSILLPKTAWWNRTPSHDHHHNNGDVDETSAITWITALPSLQHLAIQCESITMSTIYELMNVVTTNRMKASSPFLSIDLSNCSSIPSSLACRHFAPFASLLA
jgi:hypothetical protein